MSATASGLILGFLLATLYGAGFHLIMGGRPGKIVLYLVASWIGFTIGHFIGDFFAIDTLKLGAVHLLTASVGAWIALLITWILSEHSE